MRWKWIAVPGAIALVLPAAPFSPGACGGGAPIPIMEASGIARRGDRLLIVGDDADGRYFEFDPGDVRRGIIPIEPSRVRERSMPGADLAMDLEAIGVLADGRVAVLSEQSRCLIARERAGGGRWRVVAEYDRTFSEFGNLGLEGLAAVPDGRGGSRVAVMWEGGWPMSEAIPPQLRERAAGPALLPVVAVHTIPRNGRVEGVVVPDRVIPLHVPEPPAMDGEIQRFRGSDLVWHRWHEGGAVVDGFIVLLTSRSDPAPGSGAAPRFRHKILQRFDLEGDPVGRPLDLKAVCRATLGKDGEAVCRGLASASAAHLRDAIGRIDRSGGEDVNWEGLDWYDDGERLIAIYDTWPADPPFALLIPIPDGWK